MIDKQPTLDGTVNPEVDSRKTPSSNEGGITIQGVPYKSLDDYDRECRRAEGYGDPESYGEEKKNTT